MNTTRRIKPITRGMSIEVAPSTPHETYRKHTRREFLSKKMLKLKG